MRRDLIACQTPWEFIKIINFYGEECLHKPNTTGVPRWTMVLYGDSCPMEPTSSGSKAPTNTKITGI